MTQEQIQQFIDELSDQELRDYIKGLAGEDPEVGGKLCSYAITQRGDSDTENVEFSVDCVFGRLDLLKGRKKRLWLTEWDHIENESEKLFEWASKAIASERPDIALVIGTRWLENFAFFSKEKKTLYDELYEIKNEFERDTEIHRLDQRFCKACEKAINAIDEAIPYPNVSEEVKNDIAPRLESLDTPMSRTISYYCSKFYGLPFRVKAFCLPEKETLKALEQRLDTDFNNTALIKQKYRLLLKMGLSDEAEEFVEENIDNYDVADAYVQDLFNAKRFDKLISVLLDITDSQYETGTRPTRRWLELLAQCQQSLGLKEDVIDTYRRLFILSNGKIDYYHILKQKVAEQDWPEFLEQMVQQTRFPNYYTNGKDDYAELLILEGRFEDLQQWIKTKKDANTISYYLPYIPQGIRKDIFPVYHAKILSLAEKAGKKEEYTAIANLLAKIKELPDGEPVALKIAASLKEKYPRKSIFMGEIKRALGIQRL